VSGGPPYVFTNDPQIGGGGEEKGKEDKQQRGEVNEDIKAEIHRVRNWRKGEKKEKSAGSFVNTILAAREKEEKGKVTDRSVPPYR